MEHFSQSAKAIIEKIYYITIATVSADGQPWNTPVFCAYDEDYNFYWGSDKKSQHSLNIADNSKIFLVIYDSTVEAGSGEGVYIRAKAVTINDEKQKKFAHKLIQKRRPVAYWKLSEFSENGPIQLYKAVPIQVWRNFDGRRNGVYVDKRKEIAL